MNDLPQSSGRPSLRELLDTLQYSLHADQVLPMLCTLFEIAYVLMEKDDKAQAFEILTCIVQYPMPENMTTEITLLLDHLEFQLCPRVVLDARQNAKEITLDDLAVELLDSVA